MELTEHTQDVLDLYARTHDKFYKLNTYKFLVGVLMLYLGLFYPQKTFHSNACHIGSSYVLKLFNQDFVSYLGKPYSFQDKTFPKSKEDIYNNAEQILNMKKTLSEDIDERFIHTIQPSTHDNKLTSLGMILYFIEISNNRNFCNIYKQRRQVPAYLSKK